MINLRSIRSAPTRSKPLPAPVGGWNDRDSIAAMDSMDAIVMENWFPTARKVKLRSGYEEYADPGVAVQGETLIQYNGLAGEQFFVAVGNTIYDITTPSPVADVTGLTNARWQQVQMGTSGGQFTFICNGEDTPRTYNGSAWANTTITGPTVTDLIWCNTYQNILFVGEKESLSFWYGASQAIGGAFTEFPLSSIADMGGYLMGMGTWTRSAVGLQDLAVFVTSQGQLIVYQGTDPGDPAEWQLVGTFNMGKPIGRRFFAKSASDLLLLTDDGLIPISNALPVDRAQSERVSLTDKISNAINAAIRQYGANYGWEVVIYNRGQWIQINVPVSEGTTYDQYVFNSLTNAACKFTNLNGATFAIYNDALYFTNTDGRVMKADVGESDDGANIVGDVQQAYWDFDNPAQTKRFTLQQPIFEATGNVAPAIDFNVDYRTRATSPVPTTLATAGGLWDVALWDQGIWGGENEIFEAWRSVTGIGRVGSTRIRVETNTAEIAWLASYFVYEPGGFM